jgi:DNA primase catalytic core
MEVSAMALPLPYESQPGLDRGRMLAANMAADEFYRVQLQRADGPRHYLEKRGFAAVIHADIDGTNTWSIGYAPPGWTTLTDHLTRQRFTEDELLAAGLARRTGAGRLADVFRDRIVFPIRDATAQTVGFIGRAAPGAGPDAPKYLNTRDTVIYHKGQMLYGLAEQSARLTNGWAPVLVEGPLDVLAVWLAQPREADVGHAAVATCGSMLTSQHVATVCALPGAQRHGLTTCFDNDSAGRDATVRAWRLIPSSIGTFAATLPDGADPADHAHRLAELLSALADGARPLTRSIIDIHLDRLVERHPGMLRHVEGRVQAVRALAALLVDLPAAQLPSLARYIAGRTHTGLDTVTEAFIDALERLPGPAVTDPDAPPRPPASAHQGGTLPATPTRSRGQTSPLRIPDKGAPPPSTLGLVAPRHRSR